MNEPAEVIEFMCAVVKELKKLLLEDKISFTLVDIRKALEVCDLKSEAGAGTCHVLQSINSKFSEVRQSLAGMALAGKGLATV